MIGDETCFSFPTKSALTLTATLLYNQASVRAGHGVCVIEGRLTGGPESKATAGLHAQGWPPGAMPGNKRVVMSDEWLAYSAAMILETWQREIVPALLAGRAARMTINADVGSPLKFECTHFFKDRNWPPAKTGRPHQ